jgi:serine O-acetyltransferase
MFENLREDWQTYERDIWRQGLWTMVVYRFGRWRYRIRTRVLRRPLSFVYKLMKVSNQILTGIDLPCETIVGRRMLIEHFGGIVINGDTVIGDDVIIRHGVTLGLRRSDTPGAPTIGDRVEIGAGAKILGAVHIGNGAVIGANAVVLNDVPAGACAVGIPARVLPARNTAPQTASIR